MYQIINMTKNRFYTIAILSTLIGGIAFSPTKTASALTQNDVTIGTYNALVGMPNSTVINDIKMLFDEKGADVLVMQENYSDTRRGIIKKRLACDTCAFNSYMVDGSSARKELIVLWRKNEFNLIDSQSLRTTGKIYENGRPSGPLYLNSVQLSFNNGSAMPAKIIVANNHLPSLVDRDDDGRPNTSLMPKRVKLYGDHMNAVNDQVNQWKKTYPGVPIFVAGDYNVNYRIDKKVLADIFPTASFRKIDGRSNWQTTEFPQVYPRATTHIPVNPVPSQPKNRLIDYVFSMSNGSDLRIRSTHVVQKVHSDHNAVTARYTFTSE